MSEYKLKKLILDELKYQGLNEEFTNEFIEKIVNGIVETFKKNLSIIEKFIEEKK
jgi:hypothetical protein